jgi:hypothetical protein
MGTATTADICNISIRRLVQDFDLLKEYYGTDVSYATYTDVPQVISRLRVGEYIDTMVLRRTYHMIHWFGLLLKFAEVVCEKVFGVEHGIELFRDSIGYLTESGMLPGYCADDF